MRNHPCSIFVTAGAIDDEGRSWIEVIPVADKQRNGRLYFTITPDDLKAAVAYIGENAERILVDRDHEGAENGSTRAAGWFTGEAKVIEAGAENPDGNEQKKTALWAQIEWTPTAQQEIKDGDFRFISAEWEFSKRDTRSGLVTGLKSFIAATLTNRPFFKDLAPLTAAEGDVVWSPDEGLEALRQKVYAALNPDGIEEARYWVSDIAPGKALVQEYGAGKAWVVAFTLEGDEVRIAAQGDWIEAEQEWVAAAREHEQVHRSRKPFQPQGDDMDTKALATSLGLAEDADEQTILAAVAENREKAEKAEELEEQGKGTTAVDEETMTKLIASAAKGEEAAKKLHDLERDTMLSKAVEERKILPVQKETYAAMFDVDPAGVKALLEATPAGSFTAVGSGEGLPEGDEERLVARTVKENTAEIDGRTFTPDEESAGVDVKARKLLKERNIGEPTEEQFASACDEVMRAQVS